MNKVIKKELEEALKIIPIIVVVFLAVDSVYLTISKGYFNRLVKSIQGSNISLNIIATILCYVSLILGLYYFVIRERRPLLDAFLLGVAVYSVFEFTNKAIFDKWSWEAVIFDSIWGGVLYYLTTYFVYKIYGIK